MIWQPTLLDIRIGGVNSGFRFWLPLFLVWPPFMLVALAFYPLVILMALLLWPLGWGKTMLLTGPWLFRMFCALKGLAIDVKSETTQVYIVIK